MRRRTARLVVTGVVLTILLLAATGAPTVDVAPTAVADRPALALCVEDTTRTPAAVRAAVTELDSLDEVATVYHRGASCIEDSGRILRVRQANLPPTTAAYADADSIVLNRGGRFGTYGAHERYLVVLHELMHIVLWKPDGPDWVGHSGHAHRCDSVLSHRRACIFQLDGLTDYDREQVRQRYGS